ncbi:hypothetical protein LIER_38522 [Lithospermum erythrorhizon]|uniref:IBB domain-containing protein n=1 Tax=Lithospermum erythrorhizon TaxID=34254 RepID=A0AAV3Q3F8_LITER
MEEEMVLGPSERTAIRGNRYKVVLDADDGRRQMEGNIIEMRKNRRKKSLFTKRNETLQLHHQTSNVSQVQNPFDCDNYFFGSYLQSEELAEDTNNISFKECNDLKFEVEILLEGQVEHVVEIDVITKFDMITKSNDILGGVNVKECQLAFMKNALDGDFSFDPWIE